MDSVSPSLWLTRQSYTLHVDATQRWEQLWCFFFSFLFLSFFLNCGINLWWSPSAHCGSCLGAPWAHKMPSLWKRITFSVASALCIGSVVLLVVALSTERWVTGRILCKTGVEIVNASNPELDKFIGSIYYGLFQGGKTKRCGLGDRRSKIYGKTISEF